MNFGFLPLAATSAASSASSSAGSTFGMITEFGFIALIIVIFYFLMIRPQRKRDKETNTMRNNLQVGDEITTVGGVMGRIVSIKDDTIVIETGADRNKIRLKKWAIQSRDTIHDD